MRNTHPSLQIAHKIHALIYCRTIKSLSFAKKNRSIRVKPFPAKKNNPKNVENFSKFQRLFDVENHTKYQPNRFQQNINVKWRKKYDVENLSIFQRLFDVENYTKYQPNRFRQNINVKWR